MRRRIEVITTRQRCVSDSVIRWIGQSKIAEIKRNIGMLILPLFQQLQVLSPVQIRITKQIEAGTCPARGSIEKCDVIRKCQDRFNGQQTQQDSTSRVKR